MRQPLGVAGLIIAANTPIANVAWKVFPALICGNAAVLKASEDTPETALAFARLAAEAGLPAGVLNVVNGLGPEAGQPLVEDPRVAIVSLHRLDRGRPDDRPRGRRATGQGVPGARRQEPAGGLRRRRPRSGCRGRGAARVLQRRPALRGGQPDHRLRRRLRRVQGAAAGADHDPEGRSRRRARPRPGDQRAPARRTCSRRCATRRRRARRSSPAVSGCPATAISWRRR